ncbi:Hypothetical protein R9X50_00630700 [Acrodontium crateriforme]|uniref:Uncharacterized protein n=1 Tax=Acrodontium crateriforme TaxID=150365 RepID=A0AAQ3M9D9_9PEZI|nr:Hypothetical protein R9X50_00630700 [Acrodontium crateriforme]
MKPFKPPTLVRRTPSNSSQTTTPSSLHTTGEPPAKKQRICDDSIDDTIATESVAASILQKPRVVKTFHNPVRAPLHVVENSSDVSQSTSTSETGYEAYFNVLWRKYTTKKNKTWDGDGILSVSGGFATLQNADGRSLGRTACKGPLLIGSELSVGGKEVEIDSTISKADFLAGRPFLGQVKEQPTENPSKEHEDVTKMTKREREKQNRIVVKQSVPPRPTIHAPPSAKTAFKPPMLNDTVQQASRNSSLPIPRHDPTAEGALVMKRPKSAPRGQQIVDVVVDPFLTKHLRPHQREGVAFLYECVMGLKNYAGEGAVLADEMGLGKTLQTIALLWTLMKQNPIYKDEPVVKKALIVCPVSLINNWRREFRKWLGNERIGVFVVDDKKTKLTNFTKGKQYSVMIIGYEKLRIVQADLQDGDGIDIVIADEGHRLKTAQNKSALAIKSLSTDRRIILSGTPVQNDLAEFHTMVDFVNPNLLNKYSTFKREFEIPINKSREPGASAKDVEKGEARSEELAEITGMFILRRTAEILSQYLPPKTEYVVFCKPTKVQKKVYQAIIGSPAFGAALGSSAIILELINILKKVCNSPNLLLKKNEKGEEITKPELLELVSPSLLKSPGASGKLQVLDSLLHCIRTTTEEKVVLVSNYTSTMDILQNLLSSLGYSFLRMDGSTPPAKRQDIVERFNRSSQSNAFVFLLSAKAGGVGLNLIGASRLILYDLDWNPAIDLQAMARIHRDGQKRPCFIYRFLTQGAIDEKIFQRQVSKTGLADSIVDGKNGVSGFSKDELRDLFSLDEGVDCQTHKILGCTCGGNGILVRELQEPGSSPRNDLATLSEKQDIEVVHLDGDSDDTHIRPEYKFISSAEYDWEAQEAEIKRKAKACLDSSGKAKMLSLMQYSHFDTSRICPKPMQPMETGEGDDGGRGMNDLDELEAAIEDLALRRVLQEDEKRVGFVFTKSSTASEPA